jgi:hypothetical protein
VPAHPSGEIAWRWVRDFRIWRNKRDGKWSMQTRKNSGAFVLNFQFDWILYFEECIVKIF